MTNKERIDSIAADIMAYLKKRPMASDSLEGVASWWLDERKITSSRASIEAALEKLVSEGRVSQELNANREVIYSLASSERDNRERENSRGRS